MRTYLGLAAMILAVAACPDLRGADWPQFRGPRANGISADKGLPESWGGKTNPAENVLWKQKLPGPGGSSPITWGNKIFLTCYSGYALEIDEPGQRKDLKLHVLCFQAADGKPLWDRSLPAAAAEQEFHKQLTLHGYASSTPATDGKAVYVFFGVSGVMAYDFAGNRLWQTNVGDKTNGWGSGNSPVLYKDLVIVNASVESGTVVALNKSTGKEVWRAGDVRQSWSTPALVDLPDGRQELVVSQFGKARALDPQTGKQLWECATVDDYVCPGVIAHAGIVYVTGGRKPGCVAIKAGGKGDVTATHKLWEIKKTPKVSTPLYDNGLLYWVDQRGMATCVKAGSGQVVYEERLELAGGGDKVYASPVLADGKLYVVSREGGAVVLAAGAEFRELARNSLDKSVCNATPAVYNGRLLLRSNTHLYCIGGK